MIVVGDPATQRFDHVLFVGTTGQEDAFKQPFFARKFLQVLGQFDAIHVGHVQITQHQTDLRVVLEIFERLTARCTWHAAVTAALQKLAEFFDNQRLVIDHHYFY